LKDGTAVFYCREDKIQKLPVNLNTMKKELVATIRHYNQKGWSPATSTNYSFRDNDQIWVTRSGIDKSEVVENDFITVNYRAESTGVFSEIKPSAETQIHCDIYALFPEVTVILHSHGKYPVLASSRFNDFIEFEGFEIQKGFAGQISHLDKVRIPIFENDQDMHYFTTQLNERKKELGNSSFIIRKHGTYAWGKNLFEAKRHLETLDYLCECWWKANR
jgi:methylthioribulose-1-phosphate dehydratase